jgi:single-strand DNA-binding protein
MASFNKVILMGNVTRDPTMRYLASNTAIAEFGLAVNRKWVDAQGEKKDEVCFVDLTAWGKQAETINQYVKKGKPLLVEGRLKFDSWDDKNGGGKRSKLSVVVESFQFIGPKDDGDDEPPIHRPAQTSLRSRDREVANPIGNKKEFEDSDIPFDSARR